MNMSYNNSIKSLCNHGKLKQALCIFQKNPLNLHPTDYIHLLKTCGATNSLREGRILHSYMILTGTKQTQNIFIDNTLLSMYMKCRKPGEARQVFYKMSAKDVFSYTTMVSGFVRAGQFSEGLEVFEKVVGLGIEFNHFTCASILKACSNLGFLGFGRCVHGAVILKAIGDECFVGSGLVCMYAKCGRIWDARRVFDKLGYRDSVVSNAMIAGHVQSGDYDEGFRIFSQMRDEGIVPDAFSYASLIPGCGDPKVLGELYEEVRKRGFLGNNYVRNALVVMFAKMGNLMVAREVFEETRDRNGVSWNVMIAGYAQNGYLDQALELFKQFKEPDIVTWNVIIEGYVIQGLVDEALELFWRMPLRDVMSWNSVISGLVRIGKDHDALRMFYQMLDTDVQPDQFTFATILPACSDLHSLEHGRKIHEEILRHRFETDSFIGSALVDMYAKCHDVEQARNVFDKISYKDVVVWTAIILGCAHEGQSMEALSLFKDMQSDQLKADADAFSAILVACSDMAALEQGEQVHGAIIRHEYCGDVFVGSALLDMYSKCGNIICARTIFDRMLLHNKPPVGSWNALIMGYALHGCGREALEMFNLMQNYSIKPDHITFVALLSACCHAGLVDEGWKYFRLMTWEFHITPTLEHHTCMVDLLAKAGRVHDAYDFIDKMHLRPNAIVWKSLLTACKTFNNLEVGEVAAKHLFELEPKNVVPYVLLSNLYAASGRWKEMQDLRNVVREMGLSKKPGCSWIQVKLQTYAFVAGD